MRAYMKPRMMPSRRTCGKIPIRSSTSMPYARKVRGSSGPAPSDGTRFLGGGSGDRQLLDDLVVAPLSGVVAGNLQDEVERLLAVALAVELDVAGDAVGELGAADRGRDVLAARHLAALRGGLDTLEGDRGGVVGLGRVRLGVFPELLLELLDERLGPRQLRGRTGRRGVVHADHGLSGDLGQVGRVHPVGAEELALDALLAGLLEERRGLIVDAAEVDHVRVLRLHRRDDRVEVRLFFGALEAEDLDALLLGVGLEELGDALTVRSLVVDDVDGLCLHRRVRELGADDTLDIVTPAHAVDVRVAAVGDDRIRVRRRDHRERDFLVDLGRRDRHARVQVTDDGENVLVGDDVLRVGDADVGLGLVVEGDQLHLEALLLQGSLELLDRQLRAELDALAERRLTAAERTLRRDLDGALAALPFHHRGREPRHGQNGDERKNEVDPVTHHRCPPYIFSHVRSRGECRSARRHYSGPRRFKSRSARIAARNSRVAAAGSGAPQTAEITATPSAPARITWATFSRVIPPMPISGALVAGRTARISSGPTSSKSGLVCVGNIEPTAM